MQVSTLVQFKKTNGRGVSIRPQFFIGQEWKQVIDNRFPVSENDVLSGHVLAKRG